VPAVASIDAIASRRFMADGSWQTVHGRQFTAKTGTDISLPYTNCG
jgi:hypothetical protein